MPLFTKHYSLPTWRRGEVIDPAVDLSRMSIIDSQLELLSRTIGDGRISGWNLTADSSTTDKVQFNLTAGRGIISKFVATTFGDSEFELDKSSTYYLYLQKKRDIVARFSSLSNPQNHVYVDMTNPSVPTGLTSGTVTFNSIETEWDANTDHDISYYILQRSDDNIVFSDLVALEHKSSDNSFTDENLDENTIYYYRIRAVDTNNNESANSASVMIKTNTDVRVPSDPSYFSSFPLDGEIQLAWQNSSFALIKELVLTIDVLDDEFNIDSTSSVTLSSTATSYVVASLDNNKNYKFTLVTRSLNDVDSAGVSIISSPRNSDGPLDVLTASLTDVASSLNSTGIALSLTWVAGFNEYIGPPSRYLITVIENGSNVSEPIEVFADKTSITIDNFQLAGTTTFEPVKPRTDYIVKIQSDFQTFSPSNTLSSGKIATTKTTNYKAPKPVESIFSQETDGIVVFTWLKSVEIFDHYEITLTRLDIASSVTTTLYTGRNIGKANSFIVEGDDFSFNSTYTLTIKILDEFGNESSNKSGNITTSSATDVTTATSSIERPPPAPEMEGLSGDKVVFLQWKDAGRLKQFDNVDVDTFHVYRADNQDIRVLSSVDFTEIAVLPANQSYYEDYDVINNKGYLYFILITDTQGRKTLNPESDKIYTHPYLFISPSDNLNLSSPSELSMSVSGADVILSWSAGDSSSDGVEVLKRVDASTEVERPIGIDFIEAQDDLGNTIAKTSSVDICDLQICNEFEIVGNVAKGTTSITLNDELVEDGTYQFRIRRYRNDVNLILKDSQVAPVDSVLLATIDVGTSEIDTTITESISDIANGESLIDAVIDDKVDNHKHFLKALDDRRVDLEENVVVRDWKTTDGIIFSTKEEISGADFYVLRSTSGTILNYEFSVDTDNKQITIFYPDGVNSLTALLLECVGLNETSGLIEGDQLGDIFANKITTGKLDNQLPQLEHFGREDEELIPLQLPLETIDGFRYENYSGVNSDFGSSTTFYDILSLGGDDLVAASSLGVMESDDAGESWNISVETDVPVHKLYYSAVLGRYFALSGNSALISADGLSWLRTFGLERTHIARDVQEDDDRAYVSTDAGVYVMQSTDLLNWEESSIIDAKNTDSYDLLYDVTNSRVLVSTQLAYYETTDKGSTWSQITEINELDPITESIIEGSYIYAIQDNNIWRKENIDSSFEKVGFVNVAETRKIAVFDSAIFITTGNGLYCSDVDADIESDTDIAFHKVGEIDYSFKEFTPLSLNVISGKLYVGTDKEIVVFDSVSVNETLYSETSDEPPTFYLNGQCRKLGVYFNDDLVVFDTKTDEKDLVSVANQYRIFRPANFGWADANYKSVVKILNNNSVVDTLASAAFPSVLADYKFGDGSNFPYSESVAHSAAANFAKQQFNTELNRAVAINSGDTSQLKTNETIELAVSSVFSKFYEVFANIHGNIKFYTPLVINGVTYKVVDHILVPPSLDGTVFPDSNLQLFIDSDTKTLTNGTQADSVAGIVVLQSETSKFNRVSADIPGVTVGSSGSNSHDDIDDAIEEVNSGLPSNLANVFHANVIKHGISLDSIYNNEQETIPNSCDSAPPLNSVYIVPRDKSWYDTLNSTIDYDLEVVCDFPSVNADYVSAVLYLSDIGKVWVGHDAGVLAVDKDSFEITKVDFNNDREEFVADLKFINNVVYVVTKGAIYATEDFGTTWTELSTFNIKEDLRHLNSVNGVLVLSSENAVYYKLITHITSFLGDVDWKAASFVQPLVNEGNDTFSSTTETVTAIDAGVLFGNDFGFITADNTAQKTTGGGTFSNTSNGIYVSADGASWEKIGDLVSQDIVGDSFDPDAPSALTDTRKIYTNAVINVESIHILATDKGLYSSEASFYGQNADVGLIDLKSDKALSAQIEFNDIAIEDSSSRRILAGASDGQYWLSENGVWSESDSGLETINKVLFVDNKYWIFGKNALKVSSENKLIRLTPGMDFVA